MSKPDSIPVPNPDEQRARQHQEHNRPQQPMSGSKKTKQRNHTSHYNPEG
ncbi:small acid-soluble spore protein P [Paenibacillus cisolokensis]|jgi:hypothetical protein|nr:MULTISPECIES: hypothetical protein [Paenibacillus]ALS25702.1 hypothetical protein IJ21_02590 [Paenibacillus sp. 32O-W]